MRRLVRWLAILLLSVGCGGDDETQNQTEAQPDANAATASDAQPAETAAAEVEEAILTLQTMSKADGWDARTAAIKRIERFGADAKRAIPILRRTLADDDDHWLVRSEAVCALAAIGPETLPDLQRGLEDPFVRVRWATAYALRRVVPDSEAAVSLLEKTLLDQDQHWLVRSEAARSLAAAGSPAKTAVSALEKALQDKDPRVQAAAASSLARIGPKAKAAMPDLRKALSDEDWLVRSAAVYALGQMGPEAIPDLRAAIKDESWGVRSAARGALRSLGQPVGPKLDDSGQESEAAPATVIVAKTRSPQAAAGESPPAGLRPQSSGPAGP